MRLRLGTLHYTSQGGASTRFSQAAGVCRAWGCACTSMEGGKLRQGKEVPAGRCKPGGKDGGRAGSKAGPSPALVSACCESSRLSERERHTRSERFPGKEGSVGSPSPAAALFQQTAQAC